MRVPVAGLSRLAAGLEAAAAPAARCLTVRASRARDPEEAV